MTESYNERWIQEKLLSKYAPSQNYFYSNLVEEIVSERRCAVNIYYEDVEYVCDDEENLKRWYSSREFGGKMGTFKEYYFYHEDCPRIFMHSIEHAYAKWQDRKRDHAYKKLKLIYNESYSSLADPSNVPSRDHTPFHISHFLLQISEYNPYSKKYYLRNQPAKPRRKERHNRTKEDMESLNHDLSNMLQGINDLSAISTFQDNIPNTNRLFLNKNISLSQIKRPDKKNKSPLFSLSSSTSLLKLNFKKDKQVVKPFQENNKSKIALKESKSKNKDSEKKLPTFGSISSQVKLMKTRSIFSVSSYGPLQKKIQLKQSKPLKINNDIKRNSLNKNQDKNYGSQKKKSPKNILIKQKSRPKIQIMKPLQKLKIKQISVGKLLTRPDQFSDKKLLHAFTQNRMRSHKSQFSSLSKKHLQTIRPNQFQRKSKNTLQIRYG